MTDVVTRAVPGMAQNTGAVYVYSPGIPDVRQSGETDSNTTQPEKIVHPFPISGVHQANNGYLDDRFDSDSY